MAQFSGSTYSAAVDESKRLIALAMLGITHYDFDKTTNKLTLYMQDGTVVEAALTADSSSGEQNVNLQSLIDDTIITTTKTNSSSKIHSDIQAAIAECKDDTLKQITNLQSPIDDTTITTTKTNSSSKIHADIQAAIAECKDDTLKQIAKKVSGSYKIATSTTEVTSADHIYLINNGSNYDLYVLVEGNPTKVGDTSIDLSDYAKLTDLDNYYDKSASDGKFATITTVDNHINDTVAHMTQDEKDSYVKKTDVAKDYSTKTELKAVTDKIEEVKGIAEQGAMLTVTKEQYDQLVAGQTVTISGKDYTYDSNTYYVVKDDGDTIVTTSTIDSTSTDSEVPTAKAVNTLLNNKVNKMAMLTSQNIDDLINEGSYYIIASTNAPDAYGWVDVLANNDYTIQLFYPSITTNCEMYIRRRREGVWGKWQRVCTTSVPDVPCTSFTFTDETYYKAIGCEYSVKNGVCTLEVYAKCIQPGTYHVVVPAGTLPPAKASSYIYSTLTPWTDGQNDNCIASVKFNGELLISKGTAGGEYLGTFSYPVAE